MQFFMHNLHKKPKKPYLSQIGKTKTLNGGASYIGDSAVNDSG